MTEKGWFAYVYFFVCIIGALLLFLVHYDLIKTALKIQNMLGKNGLTNGKFSTAFILCNYAGYMFYTVFYYILRPSFVLAINTTEYRCSESAQYWFAVITTITFVFYPLCIVLLFYGLLL